MDFGMPANSMGVSLFGVGRLIGMPRGGTSIKRTINLQVLSFDLGEEWLR